VAHRRTIPILIGIRSRLMALVIATVVPFAVLIGGGLWFQWRSDQAQATKSAMTDAQLVAAQLDDQLGNFESLLVGLSYGVSTDPSQAKANDAMLHKVIAELPPYVNSLRIFTLDGTPIGSSKAADPWRVRAGEREYFHRIVQGAHLAVSQPIFARAINRWLVVMARPVANAAGETGGVLLVGIELDRFQDALRVRNLPDGGVIQVVDENGLVITRSADVASWLGRDMNQYEPFARHLAVPEAAGPVLWPDNTVRLTVSATARWIPWRVSVGLPVDTAFANVMSRLLLGAGAGMAALMTALALAWILSGRIITPLRQLRQDAATLAAGDLSHRSTAASQDEVGVLATAFNAMAAALEERHGELDAAHRAAADEAMKRARSETMQREAKETLGAVIDASPVAIVCSDIDRRIVLWSRAAEQIFGFTADEVLGQLTKLVPPEGRAQSQALFEAALNGETVRDVQVKRMRKDGSRIDIRVAAAPMYDADGTPHGVAWAYEDITLRKKAEEQLERLAHFDQLTGLPNRLTLNRQLGRLLAAGNGDVSASIALFDLDGFKDVNDTLGHSVGDHLLIEVGQRLSDVAGDRGQVCRLGGDEFVVVIPDCGDPRIIGEMVDAMLASLAEPFEINDHVLHLGGSAGIAIAPHHGTVVDELIANADLALYDAKSSGGHTRRYFLPMLRAQAEARRGLAIELRHAFQHGQFELFFQPQVRLSDRAVVGAEALLRWRHPTRGLVAPGAFIDALADSPIALEVGRWILHTACEKAAQWRAMGLGFDRIAVNLFPSQLNDKALVETVEEVLAQTGLPAEVLELEITENVALEDENAIMPLQQLYERGVRLALDDFGTGYASLNCLTRFPLSRIKVDRHFVTHITDDGEDAAIVRSLMTMAHNLGLGVIAEGVETAEQAAFLAGEKCEEAQGFLYGKPQPADEFEAYLKASQLALVGRRELRRMRQAGAPPALKAAGRRR
jgi:diguanylate cyclase (GGDEF)-like protein/PAS domain S-box-containing protein